MTRPSDAPEPEIEEIYIRRDAHGAIVSVSRVPAAGHVRAGEQDQADVTAFLHAIAPDAPSLAQSDLALIRVIEDLVDVLIEKEVLRLTDLPERAQAKLLTRQRMRSSLRSLTLFGEDDETV